MPNYDIDDLRDGFLYTIIDDYLTHCNQVCSIGASASGQAAKLSEVFLLRLLKVWRQVPGGTSLCQAQGRYQG